MRLKRNHNSVWLRGFVVVLLGAALAFAAAACGDDDDDATPTTGNTTTAGSATAGTSPTSGVKDEPGKVDVLGIWGGDELTNFEAMVKPWKDRGGDVNFTGTRNITADLTVRVEGNNAPDVAMPAECGRCTEVAQG